ncbi:hypothetical protein CEXT_220391 [Caerostris extrusa]|uniref:Uncharacterized protein n=1 Tax=Caerostris extrusa TaxID=172846 RepID=A0AAV4TV89_CAEEX|nr:hypothetical protein CEXT_220391 [Caerostris extrusa]
MAHVLARVFDLRSPPSPLLIHLGDCSAILSVVSGQIKSFPNGNASMHALALPLGRQRMEIVVVSNPFVDCDTPPSPRRRLHSMLYESFATRSTRTLNKRRRRTMDTPRQRRAMPVLDIFSMNHPWTPPLTHCLEAAN